MCLAALTLARCLGAPLILAVLQAAAVPWQAPSAQTTGWAMAALPVQAEARWAQGASMCSARACWALAGHRGLLLAATPAKPRSGPQPAPELCVERRTMADLAHEPDPLGQRGVLLLQHGCFQQGRPARMTSPALHLHAPKACLAPAFQCVWRAVPGKTRMVCEERLNLLQADSMQLAL